MDLEIACFTHSIWCLRRRCWTIDLVDTPCGSTVRMRQFRFRPAMCLQHSQQCTRCVRSASENARSSDEFYRRNIPDGRHMSHAGRQCRSCDPIEPPPPTRNHWELQAQCVFCVVHTQFQCIKCKNQ